MASNGTTSRPCDQLGFAKLEKIHLNTSKKTATDRNMKQQAITKNFKTLA